MVVRNRVAHHGRCWDYLSPIKPMLKSPQRNLDFNCELNAAGKIYNTLLILLYLIQFTAVPAEYANEWGTRLYQRLNQFPHLPAMGFPQNWYNLNPWREIIAQHPSPNKPEPNPQ